MNILNKLFNRPTPLIINGTKVELGKFGVKVFTSNSALNDNIIWYLKKEGFIKRPTEETGLVLVDR